MEPQTDALVLFGATGDLAFKKIFPALQAMIKRGHLTVPVIGVAKANRHEAELRDRIRESLTQFGGGIDEAAFSRLIQSVRFVDGLFSVSPHSGNTASPNLYSCRSSLVPPIPHQCTQRH